MYKSVLKKAFAPAGIGLIALVALGLMPGELDAHNLQICKASDPAGPVSGEFSFTVVGPSNSPLLISVSVGQCVTIPNVGAGNQTVTEDATANTVLTSIVVAPSTAQRALDLSTRTAIVYVADAETVTVTFTNRAIIPGRFTGGGSIFTSAGVRVTHGMELHCNATQQPNNLEINFGPGASNQFHLESLTNVYCSVNSTTGVVTITGSGIGSFNGVPNATIQFTFTDAGEPGRLDFASYFIRDSAGTVVLDASGNLTNGNQQFHPQS